MAATKYQRRQTLRAEQQALKAQKQAAEAARNTFTARLATAASGLAAATSNTLQSAYRVTADATSEYAAQARDAASIATSELAAATSQISGRIATTAADTAYNANSAIISMTGRLWALATEYTSTSSLGHNLYDAVPSEMQQAPVAHQKEAAIAKPVFGPLPLARAAAPSVSFKAHEIAALMRQATKIAQYLNNLPPEMPAGTYMVNFGGETYRLTLPAGIVLQTLPAATNAAITAPQSSLQGSQQGAQIEISSDADSAAPAANTAPPFKADKIANASDVNYNDAKKTVKPGFWSNALTSTISVLTRIKAWLIAHLPTKVSSFLGLTSAAPKSAADEETFKGNGSMGKMGALGRSVERGVATSPVAGLGQPEASPAQSLAAVNESEPAAGADLGADADADADADAGAGFALR